MDNMPKVSNAWEEKVTNSQTKNAAQTITSHFNIETMIEYLVIETTKFQFYNKEIFAPLTKAEK